MLKTKAPYEINQGHTSSLWQNRVLFWVFKLQESRTCPTANKQELMKSKLWEPQSSTFFLSSVSVIS